MKKFALFLPLIVIPMLSGCCNRDTPTYLTYGTYKDTEAVQLSSSDFTTRVSAGENFLMAIYPKDSDCFCWKHFSNVINEVVQKDHLLIYKFYAEDVDSNQTMKDMGGFYNESGEPTFYIIRDKEIAKSYKYSDTDFYNTRDGFLKEIQKLIVKPKMYFISETQLDEKIARNDSFPIYYSRYKCSDCNYVTPNTLMPYFGAHKDDKGDIYVLDLQSYRDEDPTRYQELKDKYLLSTANNPELGFEEGVFPTFQYYRDGSLYDMCVYFNEGPLTAGDGCYYASNAYYNETRISKLHYLGNVETKDLTKVRISPSDVTENGGKYYWNKNSSSSYYDPILRGFLDTYL